jgi:hypothetical protein
VAVEEKKKGRDAELIAIRDECLYHRYFYFHRYLGITIYEQQMELLSRDFSLSKDTIPRIIEKYVSEIQRLKNEPPTLDELKEKAKANGWPSFIW